MGGTSKRPGATVWLAVVVAASVVAAAAAAAAEKNRAELGCFCDCMKNRCMTLGTGPNKFDCAAACTEGCMQIGQPGQPKDDAICGF